MAIPESLAGLMGRWTGSNRLHRTWMEGDGRLADSASTATLAPAAGGCFATLTYTWAVDGKDHEGLLLLGRTKKSDEVTAAWVDSWHQSEATLHLAGTVGADGTVSVLGSYPAPEGPDWGWRITLGPGEDGSLRLAMYNIEPGGPDDVAVEARYTRA